MTRQIFLAGIGKTACLPSRPNLIATEGAVRETSGSLHDCQNAVRTSGHSGHTLCLNRIRLIRIRLIRTRLIRIRLIHIHLIRIHHIHILQGHHNHQDHHQRRINLRVGQTMQELVQVSAPASGELRERHLEGGVLSQEDINVYPPQNAFSLGKLSLAAMRM